MKYIFCTIILLFSIKMKAQKIVEKTINEKTISTIVIEGDNMFNIKLTSKNVEDIRLITKIEGEYSEDILVLTTVKEDSLIVSSTFQPLYINHNDKLSAHKVLSIETELIVPKGLNVYLKSNIASTQVTGEYKTLTIELFQGSCILKSFTGNAIVNTIDGQILLNTNFARIEANTKTGVISQEKITTGNHEIVLNSVNGNISITKTKK